MLNLWKKIQEKGLPNSPKKESVKFNSLGPRYDGPLKCFDVNLADDIVPLEKCRLLPEFKDIFHFRSVHVYFKYFLDSKMLGEILPPWDEIVNNAGFHCNDSISTHRLHQRTNENPPKVADRENSSEARTTTTTTSNGICLRLSQQAREKLTMLVATKNEEDCNDGDVKVDRMSSQLEEILLEYWSEFVRSEWYCRYQIDLLTSRSVTLGDILLHETALSYFMQFLEVEGCHHVLEFWLAASNFQQLVQNYCPSEDADLNQMTSDAICIYEKYLSLLATSPLGFNDSVRCAVEEAICDEIRGPHADSFQVAVNIALAFLRKHYLIPFLSSQHYVHLLSDMIRQCASVMDHTLSSSSSSSCSVAVMPGEHSMVESSSGSDCEHLRVSSNGKQSLKCPRVDPESIWHRRKQSGLSFGRVDQLGRYCRDIEPDPGRNDKSKISKIMKKWIQKNVVRIEEEMAWQVAEMVVKDVTDLTMGNGMDQPEVFRDCFHNKYFV